MKRLLSARRHHRRGKVLVLLAICLPAICGMIGLVIDGGLLFSNGRQLQHATDSAATAAAMEKRWGKSNAQALAVAEQFIREHHGLADATVTLYSPPINGEFVGSSRHLQIIVEQQQPTFFMRILNGRSAETICGRATAGWEASSVPAAIVVLDPGPPPFAVSAIPPLLPPLPAILGGLEVLGLGKVEVDGAVHVNTEWGGVDEHNELIGEPAGLLGLSNAVSATPLIALSRLKARELRVVGGVDRVNNYGKMRSSDPAVLQAGRLPVPDPFRSLPVPTLASDPTNVKATNFGGKTIIGIPLIGPTIVLQPGVYDYIEVVAGKVLFQPGVYIIRGKNPLTLLPLKLLVGEITAEGVMFYITDTNSYSPSTGAPDCFDGETTAPTAGVVGTMVPAAVVNIGLLGSKFTGIDDPASPYNGMLFFQRRHDRRPLVFVQENLLGNGSIRGNVYSKWGHTILAGKGDLDLRFVSGTMRIVTVLDLNLKPTSFLPAAEDVYLVE
ncbi:TadE/TadG family type IV pilus assembly protein [Anatilimnocola floriformis]|uniref:TadE/TadG family type IV pilus assembly protein n=1 Tax=Anatilimnocola floriformis TaxID=2948575 RepID=UPI0020C23739|nr:pilus assembly protein TadG-related protein [Anatilimnocola floriformis]